MSLMFSVGARMNPMDKNATPKYYATAQAAKIIDVRDLCKSCRAHSTFTMGDSMGVIETILEHAMEEMKVGNMVRLGGLGNFRLTINAQEGTDTETVRRIPQLPAKIIKILFIIYIDIDRLIRLKIRSPSQTVHPKASTAYQNNENRYQGDNYRAPR